MKAAEIRSVLEEKFAFLSGQSVSRRSGQRSTVVFLGAIDKKGYFLITFPSSAPIERLSADDLKKLIIYLASIK